MNGHFKIRTGPDGVLFFNRQTGINILVDELYVPDDQWSRAPRQVSIALTNACDLRCPYCYAPKHAARLNPETVQDWLRELDKEGCFYVGFGGGEPTIYPGLANLCEYATRNTRLAVSFTTHAHRLNDRLAADLKGNVHFIRVSMDGVGDTYKALRGRDFTSLRRRLELVRTLAPFGINFVVNARTFSDIDAAVSIARESGAMEFLLLPERKTANSDGIDPHTRNSLNKWIASSHAAIRMAVSESDAEGLLVCQPLKHEVGLRSFAHIDAQGVLKRSSFDCSGVAITRDGLLPAFKLLQRESGEAT